MWVEIKVTAANDFGAEVEKFLEALEAKLPQVQQADSSIGGVLLMAARAEKLAGAGWAAPKVEALLHTPGSGWRLLCGSGPQRVARGQAKLEKPPVAKLWKQMEWFDLAGGAGTVGLLFHFLQGLGLPTGSAGKRARTFNKLLGKAGHPGRLVQKKIPNRAGDPPWVGSKETFREVYKFL